MTEDIPENIQNWFNQRANERRDILNNDFQLDRWFDLSKKITREEVNDAETEIYLCALKEGLKVYHEECQNTIRQLRAAVKEFNKQFKQVRGI